MDYQKFTSWSILTEESVRIVKAESQTELRTALSIREEVFIEEQDVPPDLERDGLDDDCTHFLLYSGEEPVGTGRMRALRDDRVKLERMAVLQPCRNKGLGRRLLDFMLEYARNRRYTVAVLHAQMGAYTFYERAGFQPKGEPFLEAGIEHMTMERSLDETNR